MTDPRRLTDAALAAIGERVEKATEGPWESDDDYTVSPYNVHQWHKAGVAPDVKLMDIGDDESAGQEFQWAGFAKSVDAEFVASARSDVPALLKHIAWQAEQLAEAERDARASADVVDQLVEAHRERQDLLTAMTQKVMEQSGQLASATDPATVAAMRKLLREIWMDYSPTAEWGDRCDRIRTLLGPAATEEGGQE